MQRRMTIAGIVIAVGLLPASCLDHRDNEDQQAAAPAAGHWLHTQRLQNVMRDLQASTAENWPQELDEEHASVTPNARQAALDEACRLAKGLAEAAQHIPVAAQGVKMSEVDRRSFQAQVDTLKDQALELDRAGQAGDVRAMDEVLDRIGATCASCHQRFRDYAGPMRVR